MMPVIYYPEAAAHLTFLHAHLGDDDYRELIWHIRAREQSVNNDVKASQWRHTRRWFDRAAVGAAKPSNVITLMRRVASCLM